MPPSISSSSQLAGQFSSLAVSHGSRIQRTRQFGTVRRGYLGGIPGGIPRGTPPELPQGNTPGRTPGVTWGCLWGCLRGIPWGISLGIPRGIPQGISRGEPWGLNSSHQYWRIGFRPLSDVDICCQILWFPSKHFSVFKVFGSPRRPAGKPVGGSLLFHVSNPWSV